jgi:hypothetical protein
MTSPTLRDALEALEPFAKIATRYAVAEAADGKHWPDPHWVYVELGDCRKAAEALRANSSDVSVPRVVDDIASERKRQVEQEGWSVEHDDADHGDGELSMAAMAYVQSAVMTIKAPTYTAKSRQNAGRGLASGGSQKDHGAILSVLAHLSSLKSNASTVQPCSPHPRKRKVRVSERTSRHIGWRKTGYHSPVHYTFGRLR